MMEWDVLIYSVDVAQKNNGRALEIWDWDVAPIGTTSEIRQKIQKSLPQVEWTELGEGILSENGYTVEITISNEEKIIKVLLLTISGWGNPSPLIQKICKDNSWIAWDTVKESLLDVESPICEGWEFTKAFRDYIVAEGNKTGVS